jgi:hypothetical protein
LLHAALFGGTECHQWSGYINADTGSYGRALIEYFTAMKFGIHRIPGFEPHYLKGPVFGFWKKFGVLSEEEFDEAYREFCYVYEFTQSELKNSGKVVNGKVKLNRSLRSFETEEIVPQILRGEQMIEFPANIITSYAHDGIVNCYGSWMSLFREVPVENIVMYNDCLTYPNEFCDFYKQHGGESEVWVVEKDIFGYIKVPVDCFVYFSIPEAEQEKAHERNIQDHSSVAPVREGSLIKSSLPVEVLPCESNWLLTRLIKRELDKDAKVWENARALRDSFLEK